MNRRSVSPKSAAALGRPAVKVRAAYLATAVRRVLRFRRWLSCGTILGVPQHGQPRACGAPCLTAIEGVAEVPMPGSDAASFGRRRLLGLALAAGCGLLLPPARPAGAQSAARRLEFYHIHTGEGLRATYWERGRYLPDSLREIDVILRDFRTGEVRTIDPELLDLLHRLCAATDYGAPINVISGYRCPATNAMLAARSSGVATNSFHLRGMAIDLRLPGRRLASVRDAAIVLGGGGVGFYPGSDFVHVDTGPVRRW